MTDARPAPVRWRARARTTLAGAGVVSAGIGAIVSVQLATGRDPALVAAAQRAATAPDAAALAPPAVPARRVVVVRRVIVTRIVPSATSPAPTGDRAPASTPTAAPVARAEPTVPAPAPTLPPPPVVTQGS